MPSAKTVDVFERLAQLFEKHGIYAILVIVIFFIWFTVWTKLHQTGKGALRAYYERVHTRVLWATLGLIVFTCCVWFYTNFVYYSQNFVKGAFSGLSDQALEPDGPEARPLLREQIVPQSSTADFYCKIERESSSLTEGGYVLRWVLVPNADLTTIVFTFQHKYKIWNPTPAPPIPIPVTKQSMHQGNTLERKFRLDIKTMGYSPSTPFELFYRPDSDIHKLGTMYRRTAGGAKDIPIPWEEDLGAMASERPMKHLRKGGSSVSSFFAVFADSLADTPIFQPDGGYNFQTGRALRLQLGSSDLRTQIDARNIVVENGSKSFRFIEDALIFDEETGYDRSTLVSNLAKALIQIEGRKTPISPHLNIQVAVALSRIAEYETATKFFQKAGDGPISEDYFYLLHRALAYSSVGLYEVAIKDYSRFLKYTSSNWQKAQVHINVGYLLEKLKRPDEAIQHYAAAIALDPKQPIALNNLALLYAERGKKLTDALFYASRALEFEPENANYKDTKGWVLFKMDRRAEAVSLLREAAAKLPNDDGIQGHLKAALNPPSPSSGSKK